METRLNPGRVAARINKFNSNLKDYADKEDEIEIIAKKSELIESGNHYTRVNTEITLSRVQSQPTSGKKICGRITGTENCKKAIRSACVSMLNHLCAICNGNLDSIVKISQISIYLNCEQSFNDLGIIFLTVNSLLRNVFGNYMGIPTPDIIYTNANPNDASIEISITLSITKELSKILDLRDAKNLCQLLQKINLVQIDSLDQKILKEILSANFLDLKLKSQLHICVTNALRSLESLRSESNDHLIDQIHHYANKLNLKYYHDKMSSKVDLSAHSGMFGSIAKDRMMYIAAAGLVMAAGGMMYSLTKK